MRGSQFKPRHPYQPFAYSTTLTPFLDLTQRDEGMHCDFACELFSMLENKLSNDEIHAIIGEAVEMEIEFVTSALPCGLIGMNADSMTEYVKYCADRLIVALGAPKLYNASQPFGWMEMISLQGKTFVACLLNTERSAALAACSRGLLAVRRNFFERRVSEYPRTLKVALAVFYLRLALLWAALRLPSIAVYLLVGIKKVESCSPSSRPTRCSPTARSPWRQTSRAPGRGRVCRVTWCVEWVFVTICHKVCNL